ncbi:helix-turn-helix transcriptional regulator [Sphingobacterium sp. BN32]|uniref:helix-turn-helix transcriptional regulator n=1 Tax=Sphingobacterium sp. BN32 TaxID=3058432 RepID=UPI00265CD25A|nr:helix-turn-helix transcriptional regulator [Sphingobacterium sp. BN32]WKK59299.1 helix-turn-helix transcriptional regulator [Sphingobacterium sp. BN32]
MLKVGSIANLPAVGQHAKKDDKPLKSSETEIRNIWSNWTDNRTEPCFYHSTENDRFSISFASHFLKFLCQRTFGTFAKPLKPTHNPSFAKEPNFPPCTTHDNYRFISYFLRYYCNLDPNNLTAMNRIKEVLDDKGIKQTWLAEKLGKSYNMVNSYVQNRQQPRLEILFEIAKLLEVDPKDLIKSTND